MARTVMAFMAGNANAYVPVSSLQFGAPPVTPGAYRLPSYPQRFPTPQVNKAMDNPYMTVFAIYNFERMGKMQF